ncbi:MAG: methyl-accepting chemotaxis protein [Pseudomonadota bacterium]
MSKATEGQTRETRPTKAAGRGGFGLPISVYLPISLVGLALLAGAAMGLLASRIGEQGLTDATRAELASMASSEASLLAMRLDAAGKQVTSLASSATTETVLDKLATSIVRDTDRQELRAHYDPSRPLADRIADDGSDSRTLYGFHHEKLHATYASILASEGYGDIYVLGADGRVVYSVTKGESFLADLSTAASEPDGLRDIAQRLLAGGDAGVLMSPIAPYGEAQAAASFVGFPVLGEAGSVNGAIIARLGSDYLGVARGFGETGHIALVNADGTLLLTPSTDIARDGQATYPQIGEALDAAETRVGSALSPDGAPMQVAATPVDAGGQRWLVVAGRDRAEGLAAVHATRRSILIAGLVILLGLLPIGYVLSRRITGRLTRLTAVMQRVANGETDLSVPHTRASDEIGRMARTVEVFKHNAAEVKRLEADRKARSNATREERRQALQEMADAFRGSVAQAVVDVTASGERIRAGAGNMMEVSARTTAKGADVGKAARSAADNVARVAAAAEELSRSVRDIEGQMETTAQTSRRAKEGITRASDQVSELGAATDRISTVVTLIQDIAEQTNLLALNATIEAARAGEAGKGFTVVASEVKQLATQTAQATEDIARQIASVQTVSQGSIAAISEIKDLVFELEDVTGVVSAATQQQSATVSEVARNAVGASEDTQAATHAIDAILADTEVTRDAAQASQTAAEELNRSSTAMQSAIDAFLVKIDRAA